MIWEGMNHPDHMVTIRKSHEKQGQQFVGSESEKVVHPPKVPSGSNLGFPKGSCGGPVNR